MIPHIYSLHDNCKQQRGSMQNLDVPQPLCWIHCCIWNQHELLIGHVHAWLGQLIYIIHSWIPSFLIEIGMVYSRPLLGATIASSLVPWVLEKMSSLEFVENEICLGGASKQMLFFQKNTRSKTHPCPQCPE